MDQIYTGLDRVRSGAISLDDWGNCTLLCNQASVDQNWEPVWKVFHRLIGSRLRSLLAPQHGLFSTVQDNMIETPNTVHESTGVPVYSLYSDTREPTEQMLADIDTIVVDLQNTGCRVYTFKYTLAACLRAAKKYRKRVVILDRPNPVGGQHIEGAILDLSYSSFVGEFEMPMRHGLTLGEAGKFFNDEIGAELEVVGLEGWNPGQIGLQNGRPWVLTSPNLPTLESAIFYPGMVLFEGTNISEGRGTALPFQLVGAPFLEGKTADLLEMLVAEQCFRDTIYSREISFQPTYQKWANEVCFGIHVQSKNANALPSFLLGLRLLHSIIQLCPDEFNWKYPPYEYEYEILPMKLILGNGFCDTLLKQAEFPGLELYSEGIEQFVNRIQSFLLYERKMSLPV